MVIISEVLMETWETLVFHVGWATCGQLRPFVFFCCSAAAPAALSRGSSLHGGRKRAEVLQISWLVVLEDRL